MTKGLSHDAGGNNYDNDAGVLVVLTVSRITVCCCLSVSINSVKYKLVKLRLTERVLRSSER
jgi:hypothetical protein